MKPLIKSFKQFINENACDCDCDKTSSNFVENCVRDVIFIISNEVDSIIGEINTSSDYLKIKELEYSDEYKVDIAIELKIDNNPDLEKDSHFNSLPWEEINFEHHGFAIDANTKIDKDRNIIPRVVINVIINQDKVPKLYKELSYKLLDIITHELEHTKQIGTNREPFNIRPSDNITRSKSKTSYSYFILPEEIESMVVGMYTRSKKQGVPIDKIFDKYLIPFVMGGQLSKQEYLDVLKKWIYYTLENYPDAKLSLEDDKISKIVDSI